MHSSICIIVGRMFFFFFSSRRRHTRSKRDWSSDVCSSDIRYGYDIDFEGTGEILNVAAEPNDGVREYKLDPSNGIVTTESYKETPSSYVVERTGDRPGLVALTFDDGPDSTWTPRVLDILKKERVPAAFFVI